MDSHSMCPCASQTICWLNLSQQPEIMQLQQRLFAQLTIGDDSDMPTKATKSIESQTQELQQIAAKRLILVVLDGDVWLFPRSIPPDESVADMWDAEHERPFSCIDPATASKLLVVCGMRGDRGRFLLLRSLLVRRRLASRASCRKG